MKGSIQDRSLDVALILRYAERMHPNKTVTTWGDEGISKTAFHEVAGRSRRLMSALRELGVGPEDRVATLSWNTTRHLEAFLAVPCLGATLHPLNFRLLEDDLAHVVAHAEDKVVIVDKSLWPTWEKVISRVKPVRCTIVVDDAPGAMPSGALDYDELVDAHSPMEDLPSIDEDQAAVLCYSTGTTGRPKGVAHSHRSTVLHAFMLGRADTYGLCERDVALPIVGMYHVQAAGVPYGALLAGADLVLPGSHRTPEELVRLHLEQAVTISAAVPTIWLALLEPLRRAKRELGRLALERIICGGSALPPTILRTYRDELGLLIQPVWGMTETLVASVMPRSDARVTEDHTSAGRIVPGVEARIAGEDGKELPWDGKTAGELQVRGPWIAGSYYKVEVTPDSFSEGWLRTGDVATIDAHGFLRIVDRTKDLVKSGGEWISSVELEGQIMGHPGVAEAAVIAVPHPRWTERPLACVVPKPQEQGRLTREAILDFLRPRVPKWWLPDDVVFLDEIPKTAVGKFDKKSLRQKFKHHVLPT